MKNIIKAVLNVMKSVKGMEKNSRVGNGTKSAYDGTKDKDVKEVFNKAMSENGLIILPIDIKETTQISRWEEKTNWGVKQKQSIFTKVVVKYMLMHESGESIELAGYGHGIDSQDKGSGKATTYALKNLLLYSFLTPVGKIDDTDLIHSNEIVTPPPQKKITWLTKKQFDKALKSDVKGIEATLRAFSTDTKKMSDDFKSKLEKQLENFK